MTDAHTLKSNFLANISHEVRTPLNAILGIGAILADTDLDARQAAFVETMRRAGDDLLRLLNDILDLSMLDAGMLAPEPVEFDVAATVEDAVAQFRAAAACRDIALRLRVDPSLPNRLVGDSARLRQAVANLVGNAVKFTEEGSVDVAAYAADGSGDCVDTVIEVSDTGIGISASDLERVFEPFTQVDGSATRASSGSGLGLAVVQRLVELMQGTVSVDSVVGQGTTFTIRVPLERVAATCADAAPATGAPPRVLVVEDNPVNQLVVQTMLNKLGCVVDIADNGAIAVHLVDERAYDLVFMDCQMPVKDGYTATAEIRAMPAPKNQVPIVALTASAMPEDRVRCLEAGMDEYIAKPVPKDALARVIELFAAKPFNQESTHASHH